MLLDSLNPEVLLGISSFLSLASLSSLSLTRRSVGAELRRPLLRVREAFRLCREEVRLRSAAQAYMAQYRVGRSPFATPLFSLRTDVVLHISSFLPLPSLPSLSLACRSIAEDLRSLPALWDEAAAREQPQLRHLLKNAGQRGSAAERHAKRAERGEMRLWPVKAALSGTDPDLKLSFDIPPGGIVGSFDASECTEEQLNALVADSTMVSSNHAYAEREANSEALPSLEIDFNLVVTDLRTGDSVTCVNEVVVEEWLEGVYATLHYSFIDWYQKQYSDVIINTRPELGFTRAADGTVNVTLVGLSVRPEWDIGQNFLTFGMSSEEDLALALRGLFLYRGGLCPPCRFQQ
ncbi:hypothetical protein TeGR_g13569 [Tetraparma gracilis]|uniref:F-box domain-containing protein n=1 Tax=Tetraparma gracilis TaxID=2962635 RepID=A0ABQ6ME87_9STRA|nr:hypothetical protein TeGR_g13569 [Tetraparma gracilis]